MLRCFSTSQNIMCYPQGYHGCDWDLLMLKDCSWQLVYKLISSADETLYYLVFYPCSAETYLQIRMNEVYRPLRIPWHILYGNKSFRQIHFIDKHYSHSAFLNVPFGNEDKSIKFVVFTFLFSNLMLWDA